MNKIKRFLFFRKDAESYYKEAFELEVTYRQYKKAFLLYFKSAQLGLDKGQYYVGLMMLHTRGCKIKNKKDAIVWIEMAARQNYPPAQLLMSKLYHNGEFVKIDNERGDYWMAKYNSHQLENPIINSFNGF